LIVDDGEEAVRVGTRSANRDPAAAVVLDDFCPGLFPLEDHARAPDHIPLDAMVERDDEAAEKALRHEVVRVSSGQVSGRLPLIRRLVERQ